MRDRDIREVLRARLAAEHADDGETLIVDELGLCRGEVRVDVAVVNGHLTGFEIKSEQDTLARLARQVELYSKVLDYAVLVTGPKHLEKVRKLIPRWWGLEVASQRKGVVELHQKRKPKLNPRVDSYALAQLLWREEALEILEERDLAKGVRSKPRRVIAQALADRVPAEELGEMVRSALKSRGDWRSAPAPTPSAVM